MMIQTINAALHREPISFIVYGCYWFFFFVLWTPVAILFLLVQTIWNLLTYYYYYWKSSSCHSPFFYYDPTNQPDYDMAIVVTGCDSGFGKDIVIEAAHAGYTVFAGCYNYIESQKQFETIASIISFPLDVTNDVDVHNAKKIVYQWLNETNIPVKDIGRKRVLHAVINNAGIGAMGLVDWLNIRDYQSMMDVNFFGIVRIVKAFLPIFKDQAITKTYTGMRIVNLTSMAGLVAGGSGFSGYVSSKFAAQAFTTSLRLELKKFHIAVSTVNPSFHSTPLLLHHNRTDTLWNNQPDCIKQQYGQKFFETEKSNMDRMMNQALWNPAIVSERVIQQCLKCKYPSPELLIGTDARYTIIACRMLPSSIREFLQTCFLPNSEGIECMKKKYKKS